ncbi:hypothetical protein [Methanohalophilus portucalensis]|uniref:Uncharacterized protein n=2 Tax=Methanohalophilus portucalensis TaxID=39664 RepID=A0A1X7P0F9_9EURY|nr:hypothetical protein [Methanohalophilus portucalensis]ATU08037.1 hypothetical protein BKM01_04145 [Methanohalophilus portucalensis]RNI12242.1 hypothetical protein EFE41_03805 [Methanohalophilus portucalensis FDF-1]SMH43179.1 hypothetical protein SAMN06264941_1916 [Methanohalophilus portucalensis FDF-1]
MGVQDKDYPKSNFNSNQSEKEIVKCFHCGITPDKYNSLMDAVNIDDKGHLKHKSNCSFKVCKNCGEIFCPIDILPEKHNCIGKPNENSQNNHTIEPYNWFASEQEKRNKKQPSYYSFIPKILALLVIIALLLLYLYLNT